MLWTSLIKSLRIPALCLFVFILLGLIFNFAVNGYVQLTLLLLLINCIVALSLNLVNGLTGQFSLGHAGFMAIGAYTSAYASQNWMFLPSEYSLIALFVFTLLAGVFAAIAGFIVGQPSLRLKGDYLAIVTLGFGEIIRVVLLNLDFLGGARGLSGIQNLGSFISSFIYISLWLLISFFVLWRLIHSAPGRSFLSVREDEIAAESMGVNTTKAKVQSFMISSFFAGVAGSLMAHVTQYISPASFSFLTSVNAVIMVVLGGMGSFSGSLIAAALITITPELLRPIQEITQIDLRMVIYSLALILVMVLRPKGLFGDREITHVWRAWWEKNDKPST